TTATSKKRQPFVSFLMPSPKRARSSSRSPKDKELTFDQQPNEAGGIRPAALGCDVEFATKCVDDLLVGPRTVRQLDDALGDLGDMAGFILEKMEKIIRPGGQEAVVDPLEACIRMLPRRRRPEVVWTFHSKNWEGKGPQAR